MPGLTFFGGSGSADLTGLETALEAEQERAEAAEDEKVGEGEVGVTVASQTDSRLEALAIRGLGVIEHGSDAETVRGSVFARYVWIGTVFPKKALTGDIWFNPTGAEVEE